MHFMQTPESFVDIKEHTVPFCQCNLKSENIFYLHKTLFCVYHKNKKNVDHQKRSCPNNNICQVKKLSSF